MHSYSTVQDSNANLGTLCTQPIICSMICYINVQCNVTMGDHSHLPSPYYYTRDVFNEMLIYYFVNSHPLRTLCLLCIGCSPM